jgi:electron transport complex protein RnfB
MKMTIDDIDALLPQTQCGQCSYASCRPYAAAILNQNETLDRCPPGGTKTLIALGKLLQKDVTPLLDNMQKTQQPARMAFIREAECIGCTKCIQACPVDAIIGSAKQLHTILTDECTGCGLCVDPCPVDCIDLTNIENTHYQANKARKRYQARQQRLQAKKDKALSSTNTNSTTDTVNPASIDTFANPPTDHTKILSEIQAAVARAKAKKFGNISNNKKE